MKYSLIVLYFILFAYLSISAQDAKPVVSFGIVTDIHYADIPDNGAKAYSQSLEKLKECVDSMNFFKADFLVELGDFKDMSTPPSEEKALVYLFRAEKEFSRFSGDHYHVLGNHDEDCISKQQFLSVAGNSGIPSDKTYYSFDKNGVHFIVLDANFDSTGKPFDRGQFDWGDPNIPAPEIQWLKKDLRKARGTTIVFIHQMLDGEKGYSVKNAEMVRKLLERSGKVAAVFQGHFHEGQYRFINGIHYYTLKALVDGEGAGNSSYALVEITPVNIRVKGFRRAESMQFSGSVRR
jgi:predicted phosphodiesterase